MRKTRQPLAVVALIMVSACIHSNPAHEKQPPAVLRVDNQGAQDVTVFATRGGRERVRLGVAKRLAVTDLQIRSNLITGSAGLGFIGVPIGVSTVGDQQNPVSGLRVMSPGDTIEWLIRPAYY